LVVRGWSNNGTEGVAVRTTGSTILVWIGATVLGALAPVPILAAFFDVMAVGKVSVPAFIAELAAYVRIVLPFTLGFAVVLGVPAALLCRARGWTHWIVAALGGVLIGLIGAALIMWLFQSAQLAWRELAEIAAAGAVAGIVGALVFWATLRLCGELEPGGRGDGSQAPA